MKKIFYTSTISILVLSIALSACSKLDTKIYSRLTTEEFFSNPKAIDNAQDLVTVALPDLGNGEQMRISNAAGGELLNLFAKETEESPYMEMAYKHIFDPIEEKRWNLMWSRDFYAGIGKANLTLSEVESVPNKSKSIRKVLADIKVARAYFFFQAMDCFGNVPLDTLFGADPATIKTNSRLEVFNFIEKELKENIPFLDARTNPKNRMNKYVGYALLAQLYLNAQVYSGTPRWADVIPACDSVLKGPYKLNDNYFTSFLDEGGDMENILLAIKNPISTKNNTFIPETVHNLGGPAIGMTGSPWTAFVGSADAYNSYASQDKRKNMWLFGVQRVALNSERVIDGVANTGDNITVPVGSRRVNLEHTFPRDLQWGYDRTNPRNKPLILQDMYGARNVKYYPVKGSDVFLQGNDYVLLRLAEIVLNKAEALKRLGDDAGAAIELNKIRTRAGGVGFSILNPTLKEIHDERSRELMWEGHSRRDNIRFEVADPNTPYWSMAKLPLKPDTDDALIGPGSGKIGPGRYNNMLYPIPRTQRRLNPRLVQNPGYN
jgi:starch-binding outer membrane protein, SusD/RagB family